MRRKRPPVVLVALVVSGAAVWACDDESATAPSRKPYFEDGAGGYHSSAGRAAAGADSGEGGFDAGGTVGAQSAGGAAGEHSAAGDAGSGGSNELAPPDFCARLDTPSPDATKVTLEFERRVFCDCRVKWVIRLYLDLGERDTYLNALKEWNLHFWGCEQPPVEDFKLIHTETPLSRADAATLIEHYVDVARAELTLSAFEAEQVRAHLERLSAPLLTEKPDFSNAQCGGAPSVPSSCAQGGSSGSGGTAGQGGTAGTSGAGGTAAGEGGTGAVGGGGASLGE
jgi:hypothetical protein